MTSTYGRTGASKGVAKNCRRKLPSAPNCGASVAAEGTGGVRTGSSCSDGRSRDDPEPGGTIVSHPNAAGLAKAVPDGLGEGERRETNHSPIEALAAAHNRFERIHPFLDGNGRTGRLLLNLVLVRLGYAPAIIYKRDRIKYLKALQSADRDDPGPLGELLARSVIDNLYRFIVPAVAGPARLVPLAALATKDRTEGSLRTAAGSTG